jgi:hypothetical protein
MDFPELIAQTRPALAQFDAVHYPAAFSAFEAQAAPLWVSAEAAPQEAAQALLSALEARRAALPRRKRRRAALEDKQVLALFLAPAALRQGGGESPFARELQRQWAARYPRDLFFLGSYEELMEGFDAFFFGFPRKKTR